MKIKFALMAVVALVAASVPSYAVLPDKIDAPKGVFLLTNEATGKSIELPSTRLSEQLVESKQEHRTSQSVSVHLSIQDLVDVGSITRKQGQELLASPNSTGSSSTTIYPVTATVGMEWLTYGSGRTQTVKITKVFGSFSKSYPSYIFGISLISRQGANGVVLKKNPTSEKFSYNTGWHAVKLVHGAFGPYALLEAKIAPEGMGTNQISVSYFPFF